MENTTNKKVYIIEDDPFLVKAYQFIFTKENLDVEFALDGETAVTYMESHDAPDIVLLDLMLPTMDGFEVLKRIRENPRWKGVAVLIVSNLGGAQDMEKGKNLGVTDYLVKASINLDDVVTSVKHYFHIG